MVTYSKINIKVHRWHFVSAGVSIFYIHSTGSGSLRLFSTCIASFLPPKFSSCFTIHHGSLYFLIKWWTLIQINFKACFDSTLCSLYKALERLRRIFLAELSIRLGEWISTLILGIILNLKANILAKRITTGMQNRVKDPINHLWRSNFSKIE